MAATKNRQHFSLFCQDRPHGSTKALRVKGFCCVYFLAERYTTGTHTKATARPHTTSMMECCLVNTVDAQISAAHTQARIFRAGRSFASLLWLNASAMQAELWQWMDGHTLTEASALQISCMMLIVLEHVIKQRRCLISAVIAAAAVIGCAAMIVVMVMPVLVCMSVLMVMSMCNRIAIFIMNDMHIRSPF